MHEDRFSYWVYILTNKYNNVFYVGVTSNLNQRLVEHKMMLHKGFTERYMIDKLVYFEHFTDIDYAIKREKRLKRWNKEWKMRIIKETNPNLRDLLYDFMTEDDIKDMMSFNEEREQRDKIPARNERG